MTAATDLFARQDGLATPTQLAELGLRRGMIRSRVERGEWEKWGSTLVAVAGMPDSWRRRVRAAVLTAGAGAAISHATAARMHGLDGFEKDESLHVTICGGAHRSGFADTVVHRSRILTQKQCVVIDGMLVVSRPLALVQIAASASRDEVQRALDSMLRRGDRPRWIDQVATHWLQPGVGGAALVLDVLRESTSTKLPRSWYQRLAKRALGENGIAMVDEHAVHDADGRLLAELDLAIPELMIGLECQSWEWHSTPSAKRADAARRRALRLLGWELVELWWTDLDRIDSVLAEVTYLVRTRQAKLPAGGPIPPAAGNLRGSGRSEPTRRASAGGVSRRGGTAGVPSR